MQQFFTLLDNDVDQEKEKVLHNFASQTLWKLDVKMIDDWFQ